MAGLMDARNILIRPVVSEKSYALIAEGKYTFRVDDRAHKTQISRAVEEVFEVKVAAVRTSKVRAKPKSRNRKGGVQRGSTRSWKKAIVQLAPGERIDLFEGAETA
jgi:large subunit ribosomal protein L23